MSAAQPPKRRRIAGEAKPGEAQARPATDRPASDAPKSDEPKVSLPKPKLPKRPKPQQPEREVSSRIDLPAAPPREESTRVPRAKPSATVLTLFVLAVASLAFGTYGVVHGVHQWRNSSIAESHGAASDAAASASETIFTYKYSELDRHMRESQATMTPKFGNKFKSISPALKALAPQRKIQVKAVVRYAAAKECGDNCSPDAATILIFLDQARISADTPKPVVFGNRIEVSMVKRDSKWLVDNIKAV